MRNLFPLKHTVALIVLSHSAVALLLSFAAIRSGMLPENLLLTSGYILFLAACILNTTYMIVRSVNKEILRRTEGVSRLMAGIQTMSAVMGKYAKELEQRTAVMDEYGKELEQRSVTISKYNERLNELIASLGPSAKSVPEPSKKAAE